MLGPLNIHLEDFAVSKRNGFLSEKAPPPLYHGDFAQWESTVTEIPSLLQNNAFRQKIDALPIVDVSILTLEAEWQRAYHLLGFMTHAYIWGGEKPSEILPPCISVPFLEVSSHLGLPPTATYAALNLWNFLAISPDEDFVLENLRIEHTFTGTCDEAWFYLISVAMEARGGQIIPIMLKAMDAVRAKEARVVVRCLDQFSEAIVEVGHLLERMYEKCQPMVFYEKIRPFLAGTKNMTEAGLPKGLFFDEGNGHGEWHQHSGGSNAQSTLIQLFDVFLGVEHAPTRGTDVKASSKAKNGFLQEMRDYMPPSHKNFLEKMQSRANVRSYVTDSAACEEVTDSYNQAVARLAAFRDIHLQIVTRYIVLPSRQQRTKENGLENLAVASANQEVRELHGTGGTHLMAFLKQSRDETRGTMAA